LQPQISLKKNPSNTQNKLPAQKYSDFPAINTAQIEPQNNNKKECGGRGVEDT